MAQSDKVFETKLNIYMSRILNEHLDIESISETRKGKGRPDILIYYGGIKIIIEGSYSKTDAESDINAKITAGFGDVGIALQYTKQIPDTTEDIVLEKLKKSIFNVKVFEPIDITDTMLYYTEGRKIKCKAISDWEAVDIFGLSSKIEGSFEALIKEQDVIQLTEEIESASNDFVKRLTSIDDKKNIARNLYDTFYRLYGLHVGNYEEIAELIYAQSYLALLLSVIFHQLLQPSLGVGNLNTLISDLGTKEGLRKAFEEIRAIDYTSIYEIASRVTDILPDKLLGQVIHLGNKLSSNRNVLRRDFSGRLYHKVVGNWVVRKGFATYFTKVNSAYLLSYLSVFSKYSPFRESQTIKVCDFTCGSGTLLTTSYSALEDLYKLENFEEGQIDLDAFHKKVLENNFWGFDALRYAVQVASLNLVFHNPSTPLNHMNFSSTPLGMNEKNQVELGSLRFLKSGTLTDYFEEKHTTKREAAIDIPDKGPVTVPLFDLVIMNPPFTRATGRGGREGGGLFGFILDETARARVIDEYEKVRSTIYNSLTEYGTRYLKEFEGGTFTSIGAAGEGLLFVYFAFQFLADEGKLSFVLPKSMLSGASWFLIRTFLLEKFHIEYIIVSYDREEGYNFSESTNLSEVLIIARKTVPSKNNLTSFVMLLKKPRSTFECTALAKLIVNNGSYPKIGNCIACKYEINRLLLKDNVDNWGRFVAFPHLKLLRFVKEMNEGKLFGKNIPIIRLGKIAKLGIDAHQFGDAFNVTKEKVSGSYPVFYGGGEENRMTMFGTCKFYAVPIDERSDNLFKEKASQLLVPDRIRLNTAHVISIFVSNRTLSNIFYAIKLKKSEGLDKYKALCTWINSTFGILLILANRQETEGAWIRLKLSHWRLQSILDIDKLDESTIEKLSEVADKYGKQDFGRIPNQYDRIDKVRLSYDKEVLNAVGIEIEDHDLIDLYKEIDDSFDQWFNSPNKDSANMQDSLSNY